MADARDSSNAATPAPAPPPAVLTDELVVTEHRLALDQRTLDYTVTCGTLVLR